MTDGYLSYRQALGSQLPCGRRARQTVLDRFDAYCHSALGDAGALTYQEMVASFCPPEEFAAILTQEVTPEQRQTYAQRQRLWCLCRKALVALWIVFTFYTFFIKQIPVHIEVIERTHTYEVSPQEIMDGYLK